MPDGGRFKMPPPVRGTDRGDPMMAEGRSPRTGDMLMQLGGRGGMGQNPTAQAVQLVMGAADMLMQAAQLDPQVAPVIQQTIQTLQMGLQGLGGGGPGMGGPPPMRRPRRPRRARGEEEMGEGASPEMGGAGM